MKCNCNNCKHCLKHPDGLLCGKKLIFVERDNLCEDWNSEELFSPTALVIIMVIAVAIVAICAKFL